MYKNATDTQKMKIMSSFHITDLLFSFNFNFARTLSSSLVLYLHFLSVCCIFVHVCKTQTWSFKTIMQTCFYRDDCHLGNWTYDHWNDNNSAPQHRISTIEVSKYAEQNDAIVYFASINPYPFGLLIIGLFVSVTILFVRSLYTFCLLDILLK